MFNGLQRIKIITIFPFLRAGTFGGVLEYGAEKKISKHSQLAFSVACGVPSGVKLKIRFVFFTVK